MRKLIHIAFGVLKSGKVFDPNHELLLTPALDFQDGISHQAAKPPDVDQELLLAEFEVADDAVEIVGVDA